MLTRHQATLIGSLSILLWGSLALLTRLTAGVFPPFQLLAMTFALAFGLMLGKWLRAGQSPLVFLRQPPLAWALGVGGLFGYHFCYFLAMRLAPAVQVSLLAYLWPLLIMLFSALLPGHRLSRWHLLGGLLALGGCWLLLGGRQGGFSSQYLPGYLMALLCALIWSLYSVASRLVAQVPTDAVGWFCASTALLAGLCHLYGEITVWTAPWTAWLGVLALGLGPVGIAFFTWDIGMKQGNLPLLGGLSYAAPLISTLLLLGAGLATPSWSLLLACLAIIGGAGLAARAG
ncbi:DMT family transporter [Aquitalea sp. LB_tupeE]|uniref:aromatic amino acid exporter YddG n=1 Tax=Aquitalea sp. LB_tupeE TaxID=2748078 RepID=UPI0015C0131E|nr:EamA family transporter [Aquitalea sp. LB_tupeE]NWK77826.1 EamA family transporter [Aquitalea sp. LB_tupeE]